jgi:hypothetical protein
VQDLLKSFSFFISSDEDLAVISDFLSDSLVSTSWILSFVVSTASARDEIKIAGLVAARMKLRSVIISSESFEIKIGVFCFSNRWNFSLILKYFSDKSTGESNIEVNSNSLV